MVVEWTFRAVKENYESTLHELPCQSTKVACHSQRDEMNVDGYG